MPDRIILDEDMLMISVPPNEPEIEERGGPGSGHHGHKGRPGERGGSLPSGVIKVPKLDFAEDYLDYMEEQFFGGSENPLGTLEMAEQDSFVDEHLELEDYHEIASAFAEIKARFPDLRLSRISKERQALLDASQQEDSPISALHPEDFEDFLLWHFIPGEGMGSNYSHYDFEVVINSKDRAAFLEEHVNSMEEQLSKAMQVEERYQIKGEMERIRERIAMTKDPERLREAHSNYWDENEDDQFRATMFHEFGHVLHRKHSAVWSIFFEDENADNYTWAAPMDAAKEDAYGVTARAKDSRTEAVAENFALWMMGHGDKLDREMVTMFETLSEMHGG